MGATANRTISLLRSAYRRPCIDFETLRNPVDLWIASGGRFHRKRRRKIPSPAEVLPRWRAGIEAAVSAPKSRDAFWFGFYTGMRLNEVLTLRWERVDREAMISTPACPASRSPSPGPPPKVIFLAGRNTRAIAAGSTHATGRATSSR